MRRFFSSLVLLCLMLSAFAQTNITKDSIVCDSRITLRSQLVPLGLMTAGSLVFITNSKRMIQGKFGDMTKTKIDDYIQYIPDLTVFAAHFVGIKHKNTLWNTAKYMAISQLATCIIVQTVKRMTDLPRPYGGRYTFPSGHTSQAFVGATAQYHEFKDFNPWFAYCGFVFSSAVGVMRVTNNRHWAPDVLWGAGIGMLITNLVYYYEPFKDWNPFEKKKYSVVPGIGFNGQTALASLSFTF